MIYTSSLSNMENIPENSLKLLIARIPIKNMNKYKIHHVPELSPSFGLLNSIKTYQIDWQEYVKIFRKEMVDPKFQVMLNKVEEHSLKRDVVLMCYCKNERHCHRKIIANYFRDLGYEVTSI